MKRWLYFIVETKEIVSNKRFIYLRYPNTRIYDNLRERGEKDKAAKYYLETKDIATYVRFSIEMPEIAGE